MISRHDCGWMILAAFSFFGVAAMEWPGGNTVFIPAGESVTASQPLGNVWAITNNGTLTFQSGASLSLISNVISVVASGEGVTSSFNLESGSSLAHRSKDSSGYSFYIGHLSGHGEMSIGAGASVGIAGVLGIAFNLNNQRDFPSFGEVFVAGSLCVTGGVQLTGFFPNDIAVSPPPYDVSARLTLQPGGELAIPSIAANDCAASEFIFAGGTLRALADSTSTTTFLFGNGVIDLIIADGQNAIFDTNGKSVRIIPNAAPRDTFRVLRGEMGEGKLGNGGLVKTGAGSLTFRLPAACNTFTGAVTVLQGILDLGRPLADNQTVIVHEGASFVPFGASDFPKIAWLGTEKRAYVIGRDHPDGIDLVSLADVFHTDRLQGPVDGDTLWWVSNTVTRTAGDGPENPFRLIGNKGSVMFTNTGLETVYLAIEGDGYFRFRGDRIMTADNDDRIALVGNGCYQQSAGRFLLNGVSAEVPAVMAYTNGRLQVKDYGAFGAGYGTNVFGHFAADGVTVDADKLVVGHGPGSYGTFSQSTGTVTFSQASTVGGNSGRAELTVTGGQFIVNSDLRIAGNNMWDTEWLLPSADRTNSFAAVTVSNGLLRCTLLHVTPWWTTDGSGKNIEAAVIRLQAGGTLEVNTINKNDDPTVPIHFEGGILRARQNNEAFIQNGQPNGLLLLTATDGHPITLDTQGYTVAYTNHVMTLAFTGDGGFRKLGAGTARHLPDIADYTGDTMIEGGTLQLFANNRVPSGVGKGNVVIAAGARLDLNGKTVTLNRLIGSGQVVNTNAPVVLGVLADGSSDTWMRSWLTGAITLEKLGAGELTLAAAHTVPSHLTISAGSVRLAASEGYPYYRFKIEGIKESTANAMQFSELALYNGDVNVVPLRTGIAYDPTGGVGNNTAISAWPAAEPPEKAVDGIFESGKWLDFRAQTTRSAEDRERVWLRIDFAQPQPITSYNWATGNDAPGRDPAAWRLQGSYDGAAWVDIDVKTGYVATATRNAWVEPGNGFLISSRNAGDAIADSSIVTLRAGSSLVLDDVPETIAGLVGGGTVTLNNGDLTIAAPDGRESVFYGKLSGTGGIVKEGAGVQYLSGTNTYTGATVVRDGILRVQGLAAHRWFRFSIKQNKGGVNVLQLSEFGLYSADGVRCNLGLTLGTDVSSLLPGEFATPAAYSVGNTLSETPDKLFDNQPSTKWCLINNTPNPATPSTWRTVVMRLADDTPEITGYNLCTANDAPDRDPVTWVLEGSADGQTWTVIDERAGVVPPSTGGGGTGSYVNTGRLLWYNDGVAFDLTSRAIAPGAADGATDAIPAGSVVEVKAGATLDVQMAEGIGALRVDMLDAGTLTQFIVEPNGTLDIVNANGQIAGLTLPLMIGEIVDRTNLASWTVYVDGVLQSGKTLSVDADGRLCLLAKGTLVIVQ